MNEDKAAKYHRLGRRAALTSAVWTAAVLGFLMFSGASVRLREWAAAVTDGPALTVALYVLVLSVAIDLLALPFSHYRGYLLERRYGLSTETRGHWLKDHLKAMAVGVLFAEIAAAFVYFALRSWGEYWWIAAGTGYSVAIVLLANLAPVVLLPLFYTMKPLDRAGLCDRLTSLAGKAGARIIGVYEWILSDRTKKANAALAGIGHTRRILLSDTLLAEYSDEEIEVILAHELAHHVHKDMWWSVIWDVALTFAGLFAAHQVIQRAVPWLGLQTIADPAGMPILLITAGALGLIARPILNALSRSHERRADAYALRMTNNAPAFISAMRRLGQQNLAEENPSRLVQAFFYTHPPMKERLRAAEQQRG